MGRLADSISHAGMNAGASVIARMKRVGEIETDPRLAGMFTIRTETLASIIASMRESGYDKSQPLVLWKGKGVVVDGHTRLQAAREAGIAEVPVEEKEFASLEDAKLYAYKRQAERRNLTPAEILAAAMELQPKEARDGTGRSSEILAKNLGVSPSTVKHAQAVAHEAPSEIIDEVKNNQMTINKAYRLTKGKSDKPVKAQPEPDREESACEYDGPSVSREMNQPKELPGDQENDRLERLEIRVHRENLHIPAGDDPRFEAARSILRTLNSFAVPDEFIQDVRAMLQALFQVDIDGQAEPELPGDLADPDMWGAGNEE
jgi:ParB family chromosome partitioning protein